MNAKYLNYASDLRRVAEWLARGETEMLPLASRLWRKARRNQFVNSILKKYGADSDPALASPTNREILAEQALLASIMLS